VSEFFAGLKGYWRAWWLALRGQMWPLLLVPGIIATLYFPLVAFVTFRYGGDVAAYVRDNWLPEFLKQKIVLGFVTVALWVLCFYLGFILFRNVVMILYAPVLGWLSRKTEERTQPGKIIPSGEGDFVKGAVRGITMSIISLVLAIGGFVFCVALLLIPIIGQFAMMVLLPLLQMFLAGHGFIDPTFERRRFGVGESFRLAWRNRKRVFGLGAGFVLLATVPLVGWFLAPTLGILAGTLVALDLLKEDPATSLPPPLSPGQPGVPPVYP
jgi:uncharacterized protein involved in cysteine biosynthesis